MLIPGDQTKGHFQAGARLSCHSTLDKRPIIKGFVDRFSTQVHNAVHRLIVLRGGRGGRGPLPGYEA